MGHAAPGWPGRKGAVSPHYSLNFSQGVNYARRTNTPGQQWQRTNFPTVSYTCAHLWFFCWGRLLCDLAYEIINHGRNKAFPR
jgi:hypothetical protein